MVTLTETGRAGDVVLYHIPQYSIDAEVLTAGASYAAGSVLGRVTGTGALVLSAPGAADGSETPIGVLLEETDATAGARSAPVLKRHARIIRSGLVFEATIDTAAERQAAIDALAAVGIISDS
ncbi:MAG: head decoration protein [Pseudomonadota bacterium]